MIDTLKIISNKLDSYDTLDAVGRLEVIRDIGKIATVERKEPGEANSMCPVTQEAIRAPCELKGCKFWIDHGWTKNCSLNFLVNQDKDKWTKTSLSIEQISMLYRKSPQRVESIYKRSFKIVQRHYLRDHLRTCGVPRFTYMPGFCVACQSKLLAEEIDDEQLYLGNGFGYCSHDCKKQHPPQYYEIERFFEAEFLKIVEIGSELFNYFYLEEILGFQPNVLRNRLEKLRDESKAKKKKPKKPS